MAPFSAGTHFCPGMNFAQRSMPILLAKILSLYNYELSGQQQLPPLDFAKPTLAQRKSPVMINFMKR